MSENFLSWEARAVDEAIAEETPRRFHGLYARQRYARVYRECRIFPTWSGSTWDFGGDRASRNAYLSFCCRTDAFRGWVNIPRFVRWYARRGDLYGKYGAESPIRYTRLNFDKT